MGKVRARSDNSKLFLDFYYQGVRCREQTALVDSPANRRKVEKLSRITLKAPPMFGLMAPPEPAIFALQTG